MRGRFTFGLIAFPLMLASCSSNRDALALQEAKNHELELQLQREREQSAQRDRELNAQREREASAQNERALAAERQAVLEAQRAEPLREEAQPKARGGKTRPAEGVAKAIPKDGFTNAAIDDGFKQWSASWMFDRYMPGSAHATDRGFKDGTYVIRGLFDFVRGGAKLTIPFAASFKATQETKETKDAKDGFALTNLCYNDSTSGMTDCIDPSNASGQQAAVTQSRQFLGSIVLLGLVAAMSHDDDEICVKRYSFFGSPYLDCY